MAKEARLLRGADFLLELNGGGYHYAQPDLLKGDQGNEVDCAVSSVVEHYLDTVGVGSSILPSRTTFCSGKALETNG